MGNGWAVFGRAVGIVGLVAAGLIVGRGGLNVGPYQSWPSITQPGYPAGYPAYYPPPAPQPQLPPGYVWQGPGLQPSYGAVPAQWQVPLPVTPAPVAPIIVPTPAPASSVNAGAPSRLEVPSAIEATEDAIADIDLTSRPVTPVSFQQRTALMLASQVAGVTAVERIEIVAIRDARLRWPRMEAWLSQPLDVSPVVIEAEFTPKAGAALTGTFELLRKVPGAADVVIKTQNTTSASNTVLLQLTSEATLPAGSHDVYVRFNPSTGSAEAASAPVRLNYSSGNSLISNPMMANHLGMTPVPLSGTVAVYGGFLQISGTSAGATRITSIFAKPQSPGRIPDVMSVATTPLSVLPSGIWQQELDVSGILEQNGAVLLFLLAQGNAAHSMDNAGLLLNKGVSSNNTFSPAITAMTPASGTRTESSPVLTNKDAVAIAWNRNDIPNSFDGMAILTINESSTVRLVQDLKTASAAFNLALPTTPGEIVYTVVIRICQGRRVVGQSQPWIIRKRKGGLRPTGISPNNLAETPGLNIVQVRFNPENPLDVSEASLLSSQFQLQRFTNGVFATATPQPRIIGRASNVVQLSLDNLEEGDYRLVVQPGSVSPRIKDVYGNEIEAFSSTTSEYFFPILKPVGSELPTADRGLKNYTGPNIAFPEYTNPRPSTTGFNPSDKVVSRVARLYYNRDAHRVAQLINRDARSYNRQAVTQQQQLADNARRDAENFTDERRATETQAIRAAQRARAAEDALLQAQQALTQSTTELQNLRGQLADGTNGTRDQRAELDRANANVASAQQRLEQAKAVTAEKKRLADDAAAAAKTTSAGKTTDTIESSSLSLTDRTSQTMTSATEFSTLEGPTQTVEQEAYAQAVRDQAAAERALNAALGAQSRQQQALQGAEDQLARMRQAQGDALARQQNSTRLVNVALGEVAAARETEVQKADQLQSRQAREDRAYDTLFRREVAAANEDPDTYAAGNPESKDPVAQVSISVVGEGVIQLRGPIKGVNLARMQIHDLDAPVGQVKVAVHTVQVNGERGDRIEPVVERIQRYVDHSRFLTSQSAQMLRRAVTEVASRRAEMVFAECEGLSQYERDQRYIEAFFGQQFLAELRELDSEFLRTGNKILSLHSMDTTSLAQCLFLMSLAKNDIRMEILTEFERLVTCQLPMDEMEYFDASNARKKFGHLFHKQKFQFFAQNARFVSLRGMYQAEVAGPDTLTPMQREFIRLAQIFKSRLITEIEFKQRVMERAMIEDRFVDYADRLRQAQNEQDKADEEVKRVRSERYQNQQALIITLQRAIQEVRSAMTSSGWSESCFSQIARGVQSDSEGALKNDEYLPTVDSVGEGDPIITLANGRNIRVRVFKQPARNAGRDGEDRNKQTRIVAPVDPGEEPAWEQSFNESLKRSQNILAMISRSEPIPSSLRKKVMESSARLQEVTDAIAEDNGLGRVAYDLRYIYRLAIRERELPVILAAILDQVEQRARSTLLKLTEMDRAGNISDMYKDLLVIRAELYKLIGDELELRKRVDEQLRPVSGLLSVVLASDFAVRLAQENATDSLRPLDHKKFLDMLVDDVEDKYIELLDGTRAQIANVDNYISRVITALDDDFNTQFYLPAFQQIRLTSQFYDVQVGQVETTSVLTNNRQFAKVSPQAVMEFDLPKRDILISEAFESAGAIYQDYGALLADPTFLSLTKLYSGQPTSSLTGAGLPNSIVRDVLPGLPASTDEQMLIQQGAQSPDFPSALESLIPDPAIYKFETGTGFEVRPVLQPDGQAVTFHLNYMYTTNIREPVRADEKHLGRIKRHFIDTDVQLGNFELREVSKYNVALKASRTARGVPLLEDVPVAGVLFRPLPQQQSSLQQNIILSQATIFPTLFDLMGLRWAPAVADLDAAELQEEEFVNRGRQRELQSQVFDFSSGKVDEFIRIDDGSRRPDLYRPQHVVPYQHPNGHMGPGKNHVHSGYGVHGEIDNSTNSPMVEPYDAIPESVDPTPTWEEAPDPEPYQMPPPPPSPGATPSSHSTSKRIPAESAPQRLPEMQGPPPSRPRSPLSGPALNVPAEDRPGPSFLPPTSQSAPPASRPAPQPGVSRRLPTFSAPKPPTSRPTTDRAEPKAAVVPVSGTKETQMEPAAPTKSKSWFRFGSAK